MSVAVEEGDRSNEMRASLAVQGGLVVNADWSALATVLVADGRIKALLEPDERIPSWVDRVVNATGQLVLPGGVDPHCHVNNTIGDFTALDDYQTASVAALYGGTTTIVDFAIPANGQAPADAVAERRKMASDSRCATALHGCVIEWEDTVPEQLRQMAAGGVRTVKMFTTYRGRVMAEPNTVLAVMKVLREFGGMSYVHAEANHLVEDAQARQASQGHITASDHAHTRPELAELSAVAEVLATAEAMDAPVYFVHQTTPRAVQLVRKARSRGVRAYTETCPHYLTLDESCYAGPHPERFVCCPPLRPTKDMIALRGLVRFGEVETIGSDHCCYDTEQKTRHADDVRSMPNGMPGVETRLPLIYSELVRGEGLSLERFVAITASNPARLNGLYPRKGVLAPGSDGDIVVFDPQAQHRITGPAILHMQTDYTPYESRTITGWPTIVIAAGRVLVDQGEFFDPGPVGEALHSQPIPKELLC